MKRESATAQRNSRTANMRKKTMRVHLGGRGGGPKSEINRKGNVLGHLKLNVQPKTMVHLGYTVVYNYI